MLVFLPPCLSVCLPVCLSCLTESRYPVAARWFSDRKEKKEEDLSAELQMLQSMDHEAQHMQDMLHYPEPQDIDKTGKQCGESLLCLSNRNGHNHSVDSSATVVHCVCVFLCHWRHCVCPLGTTTVTALICLQLLCAVRAVVRCACVSLPLCLSIRNNHSHSVDLSAAVVRCVCVSLPLAPLCLSIRNNHSHSVDLSAAVVRCVCVSLPLAPLCLSIRNNHSHSVDLSAAVVHCVCFSATGATVFVH